MEFKGTKGKWEQITANWDLDQEVFVEDTEIRVAKVFGKPHEQRYNALLISKAPEMLDLLKQVSKVLIDIKITDPKMFNGVLIQKIENIVKEATEL